MSTSPFFDPNSAYRRIIEDLPAAAKLHGFLAWRRELRRAKRALVRQAAKSPRLVEWHSERTFVYTNDGVRLKQASAEVAFPEHDAGRSLRICVSSLPSRAVNAHLIIVSPEGMQRLARAVEMPDAPTEEVVEAVVRSPALPRNPVLPIVLAAEPHMTGTVLVAYDEENGGQVTFSERLTNPLGEAVLDTECYLITILSE